MILDICAGYMPVFIRNFEKIQDGRLRALFLIFRIWDFFRISGYLRNLSFDFHVTWYGIRPMSRHTASPFGISKKSKMADFGHFFWFSESEIFFRIPGYLQNLSVDFHVTWYGIRPMSRHTARHFGIVEKSKSGRLLALWVGQNLWFFSGSRDISITFQWISMKLHMVTDLWLGILHVISVLWKSQDGCLLALQVCQTLWFFLDPRISPQPISGSYISRILRFPIIRKPNRKNRNYRKSQDSG